MPFTLLPASAFEGPGNLSRRRQSMKIMDTTITLFLLVVLASFTSGSPVYPLSGNIYPLGYYTASISIGNPPQFFELNIDTNTDLTWVQCDAPCKGCTEPPDQQYKPQTGSIVSCSAPICRAAPNARPCEKPIDRCDYKVAYADHGSSVGVLLRDQVQVKLINGTILTSNLAFGCGYEQRYLGPHLPLPTAGVLGLGRGIVSIASQLQTFGITQNLVAHCMSRRGGGFLALGGYPTPASGITWMPMLTSEWTDIYYYTSGAAATILLPGGPTNMTGLEFTFDSGSTYNYLEAQYYQTTLDLVKRNLVGKALEEAPEDTTLPVCWKAAKPIQSIAEVQDFFQTLTVKFSNGEDVLFQLAPQHYLIVSKNGNACFGILDGRTNTGLINYNIIGGISMQDRMVIYDNEKHQIGWFPADCTATVKP